LLTIVERVDPKTIGVEQLLAAIGTASTASATSGGSSYHNDVLLRR